MLTVNIFDETCIHHLKEDGYWTSTAKRKPKTINFVQKQKKFNGVTLFTDDYIMSPDVDCVESKIKIAWCLESPAVKPHIHLNLERIAHKFDYVFCYREDLIKQFPDKFIPNSPGGTYIKDLDIENSNQNKSKNCSLILSGKNYLPGHQLRHQIQKYSQGIDFFGWGSSKGFLEDKSLALRDYMFHITIENVQSPHYFTEKLIDCLIMKCVPIYWGCPNIGDYFDINGFVIFDNFKDLSKVKLSKQIYEQKYDTIEKNFNLAKNYISSDDFLASKILKLI